MIYRFIFFAISILTWQMSFAQAPNLVPNGSFETRIDCIWNDGDISDAPPWFNPTGATPDLFHQCAVVNDEPCPYPEQFLLDLWMYGIPTNSLGCESPYDGDGYAGFFVFGPNLDGYDGYKEYIGVRLVNPLVTGNQYTVKFYLSLPERVGTAIWNIQVYFGPDSIFQPDSIIVPYDSYLDVNPQLSGTPGQYITNYDGWHEMAWDYTASGDEVFMYIGNFQPGSETDSLYVLEQDTEGHYYQYSYYYIDNIEVREGTLSVIDKRNDESYIHVFPNPTTGILKAKCSEPIYSFQIFDMHGKLITHKNKLQVEILDIDISDVAHGLYYLKVTTVRDEQIIRKIVKR